MITLTDAAIALFYASCAMFAIALSVLVAIIYEFSKSEKNEYDA